MAGASERVPERAGFHLSWRITERQWHSFLDRLQPATPGCEADVERLFYWTLYGVVQLHADGVGLFRNPGEHLSVLHLAAELDRMLVVERIGRPRGARRFSFQGFDPWIELEFTVARDTVTITTNVPRARPISTSVASFLAGTEIFLRGVVAVLNARAPAALQLHSFASLRRYLADGERSAGRA